MKTTFVISLIVLASACGSSPQDLSPYCPTNNSQTLCKPPAFPFIEWIAPRSDACPNGVGFCPSPASQTTAVLTEPGPGQVCLKGTVAGRNGFVQLIVSASQLNKAATHFVTALDAKSLGIHQVRFAVDRPPITGITVSAASLRRRDCPAGPPDCLNSFDLRTGPRSATVKVLDQTGTVTAPFEDFTNDDPTLLFDTTQVSALLFTLSAGDYDFCLSDFAFLDASGNAVAPPADIDAGVLTDAAQRS